VHVYIRIKKVLVSHSQMKDQTTRHKKHNTKQNRSRINVAYCTCVQLCVDIHYIGYRYPLVLNGAGDCIYTHTHIVSCMDRTFKWKPPALFKANLIITGLDVLFHWIPVPACTTIVRLQNTGTVHANQTQQPHTHIHTNERTYMRTCIHKQI